MQKTYEPAIYKQEDVTGHIFGQYRVLGRSGTRRFKSGHSQQLWTVVCLRCDSKLESQSQHVLNNVNGCKYCSFKDHRGNGSTHWRGGEYVPAYFVSKCRHQAKRRKKRFDLSFDYLDKLWLSQGGLCVYTKWPLLFGDNGTEQTASLDRIDSTYDYIEGNVQFVHKKINTMKWDLSDSQFVEICKTVTHERNKTV